MKQDWAKDFAALFKWNWYAGFPVTNTGKAAQLLGANRATWTLHTGHVVQRCADLLGLYTRWEAHGRSDATLLRADGHPVALIEWEWDAKTWRDEVKKLKRGCEKNELSFASLLFYPAAGDYPDLLQEVTEAWGHRTPLVLCGVTHNGASWRDLDELVIAEVTNGRSRILSRMSAVPWLLPHSRWSAGLNE